MTWHFSIAACRCHGTSLRTMSYVVEGDASGVRCLPATEMTGLVDQVRDAQRLAGFVDAAIEMGLVNEEPYAMVLRHGCVASLAPTLTPMTDRQWTERRSTTATIVLGPSATLSLADECAQAGVASHVSKFSIGAAAESPYPPHRSPLGAEPLDTLASNPAQWCRPFGALDEDYRPPLVVSCLRDAPPPRETLTIDSLLPASLVENQVLWRAVLSTGDVMRFRASLFELVDSVVGAAGGLAPAMIDDPVSGERFGVAQPLQTSWTLRDLAMSEQ